MTPPIGFRTGKSAEGTDSVAEILPAAVLDSTIAQAVLPSRAADYAYRIAAVTAGLILLATVM